MGCELEKMCHCQCTNNKSEDEINTDKKRNKRKRKKKRKKHKKRKRKKSKTKKSKKRHRLARSGTIVVHTSDDDDIIYINNNPPTKQRQTSIASTELSHYLTDIDDIPKYDPLITRTYSVPHTIQPEIRKKIQQHARTPTGTSTNNKMLFKPRHRNENEGYIPEHDTPPPQKKRNSSLPNIGRKNGNYGLFAPLVLTSVESGKPMSPTQLMKDRFFASSDPTGVAPYFHDSSSNNSRDIQIPMSNKTSELNMSPIFEFKDDDNDSKKVKTKKTSKYHKTSISYSNYGIIDSNLSEAEMAELLNITSESNDKDNNNDTSSVESELSENELKEIENFKKQQKLQNEGRSSELIKGHNNWNIKAIDKESESIKLVLQTMSASGMSPTSQDFK